MFRCRRRRQKKKQQHKTRDSVQPCINSFKIWAVLCGVLVFNKAVGRYVVCVVAAPLIFFHSMFHSLLFLVQQIAFRVLCIARVTPPILCCIFVCGQSNGCRLHHDFGSDSLFFLSFRFESHANGKSIRIHCLKTALDYRLSASSHVVEAKSTRNSVVILTSMWQMEKLKCRISILLPILFDTVTFCRRAEADKKKNPNQMFLQPRENKQTNRTKTEISHRCV